MIIIGSILMFNSAIFGIITGMLFEKDSPWCLLTLTMTIASANGAAMAFHAAGEGA